MKRLAILAGSILAGGLFLAVAAAQEAPRVRGIDRMLRNADANGDGSITAAEARAARERRFARIDLDGDGFLTEADRRLRREKAKRFGVGRSRDADGDGRINREEFIAGETPMFNSFDANKNGVLEPDEIEIIRARVGPPHAEHAPNDQTQ